MAFTVTYSNRLDHSAGSAGTAHTANTQTVWVKFHDTFKNSYNEIERFCGEGNQCTVRFLTTEPLTVSFGQSLKDGPAAAVSSKLNDLFNSKLLKALGGTGAADLDIPTDAWTQQVVEMSEPLQLKLKCRVYNKSSDYKDVTCSTDYHHLFALLLKCCQPPNKYSAKNALIGPVLHAAANLSDVVKDAKKKADQSNDGFLASIVDTFSNVAEGIVDGALLRRGQLTMSIKTKTYGYTPAGARSTPANVEWYLKSFNATPSAEFVSVQDDVVYPLYVDFEMDFETVKKHSVDDVFAWFQKKNK